MKNLLYIGNNLNTAKVNISSIQVLGNLLESDGFNLRYASSKRNKLIRLLDMLWSCIWNSRWADAVLIDTYSTQNFYYAYVCSLVCRLCNVSYFPILHGGNLPKRLDKSPKLSASLFNNSLKNISPSIYLKNSFIEKGFENTQYIPNSILIKKYNVKPKTYDTIRLLWVRSFSKIYNPVMAVRVLKTLLVSGCDAELCMVGPDSDGSLDSVKALCRELNVDVKFTGKLSKKKWIELSKDYNIFINTTNYDNMPVSVIEVMALGFPVVSTNVGGLPYLITDEKDGLLVPKNDVYAMSNSIIKVYQNKSLQEKLTSNARKKSESYDWQIIKNQWKTLFKS